MSKRKHNADVAQSTPHPNRKNRKAGDPASAGDELVARVCPLFGEGMIFEQVAEGIRRDILAGQIVAGQQVASVANYAAAHRINPATIQRALGLLVDEGLIEKRRGIGMFITPTAREILRDAGRSSFTKTQVEPLIESAFLLGFTASEIESLVKESLKEATK